MSKRYDEYLHSHIMNVGKAGRYMVENLSDTGIFDGVGVDEFVRNVWFHDESKRGKDEYDAYDAYFYGERDQGAFDRAWLHHIHNNPHHWQHWLLMNDDGKYREPWKVVPLEMPKVHALEMVADWWSFSWRSGDLRGIFEWYDANRENIVLHDATREYVESVLAAIDAHLEEAGL